MADKSQERLDQLGEQIDEARQRAEDDGVLTDSEPEPTFIDPDPDDAGAEPEGMENAPRMTDQNTRHSPRVDDELASQGDRTQDQLGLEEEPEPGPVAQRDESDGEFETRSRLAATLLPSAFPATGAVLADIASEQHADADFVVALRSLPDGRVYETFAEVWTDLGGEVEHLPGHADTD